jgi:hypothetical protein
LLVRLKPLIAFLALAALLVAPSAAAAKTRNELRPGFYFLSFNAKGSKGWDVNFSASLDKHFKHRLTIEAVGPEGQTVSYSLPGHVAGDGTIDAKLPGVARVAVHFETTEVRKLKLHTEANCTAPKTSTTREGVFRGTIELRGEGGYTTVHRAGAPGAISEYPSEVCKVMPKPEHQTSAEVKEEVEELIHVTTLQVGQKQDGGTLSFTASRYGPASPTKKVTAFTSFSTTFLRLLPHGVTISASVRTGGKTGLFKVTAPNGEPIEATV